jgi:acyl carrier protein
MNVADTLRNFILKELQWQEGATLTPRSPLLAGVDSMALLQLVSFVEEEFEIEIRDDELTPDNFETIEAVARLIERKRGVA